MNNKKEKRAYNSYVYVYKITHPEIKNQVVDAIFHVSSTSRKKSKEDLSATLLSGSYKQIIEWR